MEKDVQGDIQRLADYCVDFAEALLSDFGGFYPCGVGIRPSGQLEPVDCYGGHEIPESQEVVDGLSALLEQELKRGEIRGYCIAYDVMVSYAECPIPTGAVLLRFRHSGLAGELSHCHPYSLTGTSGLEFLEPFALRN